MWIEECGVMLVAICAPDKPDKPQNELTIMNLRFVEASLGWRLLKASRVPRNAVVVNQKAFDALDKAGQDAVLQQAALAETRGWQNSEKNNADNLKELAAKGMKIDTVVGESLKREVKPIGDTMTADWLKSAGAEGKAIFGAYNKK